MKEDSQKNKLYSKPLKKWEALYIYLAKNKTTKKIWTYFEDEWVLKVLRDRDEHFHIKTQSYWFSDILLQTLPPDTKIVLREKWGLIKYVTDIITILTEWQYLHFLSQWFEKQIFMPIDKFKITT